MLREENYKQLVEALETLSTFEDNWNGFDAVKAKPKAKPKAIHNAFRFLKLLPLDYDLPDLVSIDEGDIVFSWKKGVDTIAEVIIEEDLLHSYKTQTGYLDNYNFRNFETEIPDMILFHLPLTCTCT